MSSIRFTSLALTSLGLLGCGSVFYEGSVEVAPRGTARTVIEASAETIGGLTVVEQSAGAGFVLEGGLPDAPSVPVVLAGFEATGCAGCPGGDHADPGAGEVVAGGGEDHADPGARGPGSLEAEDLRGLEVAAPMPRDGVWSVGGRPASLDGLVAGEVQVDGIRVRLEELAALSDLRLPPSPGAELPTGPALSAWAELEHDALPAEGGETRVVVRVRAPSRSGAARARLRVHLVIDRSSSMQRDWARVLEAAGRLIGRLAPTDELQVVAYGTQATVIVPLAPVGDGVSAQRALETISVGGGTNIEAGLDLAYRAAATATQPARGLVVLLSDGVPNHGSFDGEELGELAASAARRSRCTTSVIGLGSEFDERLLRRIARDGGGGYHVTTGIDGLARSLDAELEAHAHSAARAVRVGVRLAAGVELIEAGPGLARTPAGVELTLPFVDAGEERSVVLRVRVAARTRASTVATALVGFEPTSGGPAVFVERALSLSVGAPTTNPGAVGAFLDAHLGASLDQAAVAIRDGDGPAAAAALRAHAVLAEGRVEHARSARLAARARVVRRLGRALEALVPDASWGQRRRAAVSFGGVAAGLLR